MLSVDVGIVFLFIICCTLSEFVGVLLSFFLFFFLFVYPPIFLCLFLFWSSLMASVCGFRWMFCGGIVAY